MRFNNETDAVTYIFESLAATDWRNRGLDENTRDTAPTEHLLAVHDLLHTRREYAVVTGSKGKGSVTIMTARILRELGHTVGTITSPHLVSYRERIRVNGEAISEADFLRLVDWLAPSIDKINQDLPAGKYLSPQGIFLAMALKYFDERGVNAAVIEVGRGGRFDDNAVVPNQLSLFTPMVLEHTRYLGGSLERIAWHKAGIIKPQSYAYSLPQERIVLDILEREAFHQDAEFIWIAPIDLGKYVRDTENGIRADFGRYGEIDLPLYGRYAIDDASLAIVGAGNMHGRLKTSISHGSQEYVNRVRTALEKVVWPGRCQKLQDNPQVFIDGAINPLSVRQFLDSVKPRLTKPVVVVAAVPLDRDYPTVYRHLLEISDAFIITQTERNITIKFPEEALALETARKALIELKQDIPVSYENDVASAIIAARTQAGSDGTVLMAVAQPAIGDTMQFYNLFYEQI